MPGIKLDIRPIVLLAALIPWSSHALEIEIQGRGLAPASPTDMCVHIAGEYEGVRIEDSEAGKRARICQQSKPNNLLVLSNANFVATQDRSVVNVRFHHQFAPRLNGPVIGRASLLGFFATATGTAAPSGDSVELRGFLSQGASEDPIQEALAHTVGEREDLQSAVFDLDTEKEYLVAGARALRGSLRISLNRSGHQMVIRAIRVSLDPPWYTRERTSE